MVPRGRPFRGKQLIYRAASTARRPAIVRRNVSLFTKSGQDDSLTTIMPLSGATITICPKTPKQ